MISRSGWRRGSLWEAPTSLLPTHEGSSCGSLSNATFPPVTRCRIDPGVRPESLPPVVSDVPRFRVSPCFPMPDSGLLPGCNLPAVQARTRLAGAGRDPAWPLIANDHTTRREIVSRRVLVRVYQIVGSATRPLCSSRLEDQPGSPLTGLDRCVDGAKVVLHGVLACE